MKIPIKEARGSGGPPHGPSSVRALSTSRRGRGRGNGPQQCCKHVQKAAFALSVSPPLVGKYSAHTRQGCFSIYVDAMKLNIMQIESSFLR